MKKKQRLLSFSPQREDAIKLYCLPYAGGAAAMYRRWGNRLDAFDVVAVELPGRGARYGEALPVDIGLMVSEIVDEILQQPAQPFCLFGHSMGAILAFEAARMLESAGAPLLHLFVSGRGAPSMPSQTHDVASMSEAALIDLLRAIGGTPEEVFESPELRSVMLPIVRSDLCLVDLYKYNGDGRLRCSLTALGGDQDQFSSYEQLAAWRQQTSGPFRLHLLRGAHFFIETADEDVVTILRETGQRLSRAMTARQAEAAQSAEE